MNLSILDSGILIKDVLIELDGPPNFLPLSVHLNFFCWMSRAEHFSVSPSPLGTNWVLGLMGTWSGWAKGALGLRVWGQGLTIVKLES